jgi:hypothetical protein
MPLVAGNGGAADERMVLPVGIRSARPLLEIGRELGRRRGRNVDPEEVIHVPIIAILLGATLGEQRNGVQEATAAHT